MKKSSIILISIVAVLAVIFLWGTSGYNSLVTSREDVNSQWANVESQYQRRSDLIPNLVSTVKGYATHESSTLEGVVAARAKATQVTIDPKNLTPQKLQEYQAAQGQVSSALGKLLMITENYPDLKANQNFLELQAQLEGTENRISVERNRYNEIAKSYDISIKRLPKSILASICGFTEKPYFESEKGAEKAPSVKF
jgi:LemA protein